MDKKVLVTGSGGFVGKNLYQIIRNDFVVFGIDKIKNEFVDEVTDLNDEKKIDEILDRFNPDEIVHLAALSNVEKCEAEKELAVKQNIAPIQKLVKWVEKNDRKIIFISTDYVFDGVRGNFTEQDKENPIQYYGQTKLAGEKLVASLKKYLILRPTVVYGWDSVGMNFFMQLYRHQKDKKEMSVPIDQISNPTFVLDLCELIKKLLGRDAVGTFITTGNEALSRYDFAIRICDYMGWDKNLIIPTKTGSLNQLAKRPLNNSTSNKLAVDKFDFEFNNLERNIRAIKNKII